jgi:hypothetical protein
MLELLRPQELCLVLDGVTCTPKDWEECTWHDDPFTSAVFKIHKNEIRYRLYRENIQPKDLRFQFPGTMPVMLGRYSSGVIVMGENQHCWYIDWDGKIIQYTPHCFQFNIPSYSHMFRTRLPPRRWSRFKRWLVGI